MIVLFVLILLVIVLVAVAFLSETSLSSRTAIGSAFAIGVPVVYQREVMSNQPCAGARDIRPSERGEFYYYSLINYLRVTQVLSDGRIIAVTRDHKKVCLSPNDSRLRKARLSERFLYHSRFPHL